MATSALFPAYQQFDIDCNGVVIHGVTGGSGPPLLLLHGYPQTHVMWHKLAPLLDDAFTIVAPDLRGYGRSDKPASEPDHGSYSKRAMAGDMVTLMEALGYSRFHLGGHDRGGRVAHRLAVDWPERVDRLIVLDIAPTREMYALTDQFFARAYWWWFYLIQPAPLPENMIGADPRNYWLSKCASGSAGLSPFSQSALDHYLDCFDNPETIRGTCEDYRAAATIDIDHDNADGEFKLACPLLVLWGEDGVIERCFDALSLWRRRASDVSGFAMPGGHYIAEQHPRQLAQHLLSFLKK